MSVLLECQQMATSPKQRPSCLHLEHYFVLKKEKVPSGAALHTGNEPLETRTQHGYSQPPADRTNHCFPAFWSCDFGGGLREPDLYFILRNRVFKSLMSICRANEAMQLAAKAWEMVSLNHGENSHFSTGHQKRLSVRIAAHLWWVRNTQSSVHFLLYYNLYLYGASLSLRSMYHPI